MMLLQMTEKRTVYAVCPGVLEAPPGFCYHSGQDVRPLARCDTEGAGHGPVRGTRSGCRATAPPQTGDLPAAATAVQPRCGDVRRPQDRTPLRPSPGAGRG